MTSEQIAVQLTDHEDRIKVTEKGVANFQAFRLDTTRKIGFVYGATWFAGAVGTLFLVVVAWALTLIVPAAKVMMEDYYSRHPSAQIQQKTVVAPPLYLYTANSKVPQDAINSENYTMQVGR
jgi:hypothetical protein